MSMICAGAGDENLFEKESRKLRARLGPEFRVAVEKPFIVASDQSEADFRRSREHTIRWSVRLLKHDFFAKDPPRPLVIYLFDGKDSYRAHAKKFFGEEPDTLELVYEPHLIRLGFLERTPRGRVLTAAARRHLGLAEAADGLFDR